RRRSVLDDDVLPDDVAELSQAVEERRAFLRRRVGERRDDEIADPRHLVRALRLGAGQRAQERAGKGEQPQSAAHGVSVFAGAVSTDVPVVPASRTSAYFLPNDGCAQTLGRYPKLVKAGTLCLRARNNRNPAGSGRVGPRPRGIEGTIRRAFASSIRCGP